MRQDPATLLVYVYELDYGLEDLLRCHRERAGREAHYMDWCGCAINGSLGDAPWRNDMRGALAIERYVYDALVSGRNEVRGVQRTRDATRADLFFVPLFGALSYFLAENMRAQPGGVGMCLLGADGGPRRQLSTHESRMLGAVATVRAQPHFERWPYRHFIVGAAEFAPFILNFGSRRRLRPSPSHPGYLVMINFTHRMALINVEDSWHHHCEQCFGPVVVAPYVAIPELLTTSVRARVERECCARNAIPSDTQLADRHRGLPPRHTQTHVRKLLLFFRGSALLRAPQRVGLLTALARTSARDPSVALELSAPTSESVDWTSDSVASISGGGGGDPDGSGRGGAGRSAHDRRFSNLNCYPGKGGTDLGVRLISAPQDEPRYDREGKAALSAGTVAACKRACINTSKCAAVTIQKVCQGSNCQTRQFECFLRANPRIASCKADKRYETWLVSSGDRGGSISEEPNHASSYAERMLDSVFCLTPSGHSCTTRRFYDAIAAGCIPVRTDCFEAEHKGSKPSATAFPHLLVQGDYTIAYPQATIEKEGGAKDFLDFLHAHAADAAWLRAKRWNLTVARARLIYAFAAEEDRGGGGASGLGASSEQLTYGGAVRGILEEVLHL
jgi:hypothetical protein